MKLADEKMKRTKALPAAAAASLTDAVDLGVPNPCGGIHVPLEIQIRVPALPALANTKLATFDIVDCDTEGGSYTVVEGVGNMTRLGAGGVGAAAKTFRLFLPPNIRRYHKVRCTVEASGGDNTAVSFTVDYLS